jgi:hypothetical protein
MIIYISGPMTGYPDLNFPAFHLAASVLRSEGFTVISPAEIELPRVRSKYQLQLMICRRPPVRPNQRRPINKV